MKKKLPACLTAAVLGLALLISGCGAAPQEYGSRPDAAKGCATGKTAKIRLYDGNRRSLRNAG